MSDSPSSIFIARKQNRVASSVNTQISWSQNNANKSSESESTSSQTDQSSSGREARDAPVYSTFSSGLTELTKNNKYCVSRLPALPAILNPNAKNMSFQSSGIMNGYSDDHTQYALIANENDIYVWNYTSTDGIPVTIHFPVESNPHHILPLAILVSPSAGSKDPGLVIINAYSGHVKFYEAITSAPALGIINNNSIEFTFNLSNEFITMAENVEPAGIMIATSAKRCFLISLRDAAGRPALHKIEVLPKKRSFFNSFLGKSNPYQLKEDDDQIVAIKSSKILGQGTREVIIQDSNGDFSSFSCNRNGITKLTSAYITTQCIHQIDGYLPGSDLNFRILDISPMPQINDSKDVYLVLASCNRSFELENKNLILFTIKIDDTGVLVYSSHRITRSTPSYYERPKLFLPKPYNTAFIVCESSVILTDVLTSIDPNQIYQARWEDLVSFRENVNIIGQGYEDKSTSEITGNIINNSSIVLITDNAGVLRVERFEDHPTNEQRITEPSNFIKSHLEQAVFYANNNNLNPVEFNFPKNMDLTKDDVVTSILNVSNEILMSSSVYIPPFLPSIKDYLDKRYVASQKLVEYVHANFSNVSVDVKLQVLENLEKLNVALNLWSFIESSKNSERYVEILRNVISDVFGKDKLLNDEIRFFFSNGISQINEVFTRYIKVLVNTNVDIEIVVSNIIDCLCKGVYDNEISYRENLLNISKKQLGDKNLWIFETDLIFLIDEVFEKLVRRSTERFESIEFKELQPMLVRFVELLFYLFDNAINYLSSHSRSSIAEKTLLEYKSYYDNRKTSWNKALVLFGCESQALILSELYKDLKSLAEILDSERESIIKRYGQDSSQYQDLSNSFDYYFNKFGYSFGSALYDYYSMNGKLQTLLLSFPQYNEYLRTYLSSEKHGKISWIRDVLDSKFINSASTLLKVSNTGDELQTNRKLQLSLAKLSILASEDTTYQVKELYNETNMSLELINIQDVLYDEISNFVNYQKNSLQIDYIMNQFSKNLQKLGFENFSNILKRSLIRLIENKSLGTNELVDAFVLVDQTTTDLKNNYYWALKIVSASNIISTDIKGFNELLIWTRLLLLDDWEAISKMENKSDDYIKEKVENTILFNTLQLAFRDKLLSSSNIQLPDLNFLTTASVSPELLSQRYQYLNPNSVSELQKEIKIQQQHLIGRIQNFRLESWFKAVVGAAKSASGDSAELVDYSSLQMIG